MPQQGLAARSLVVLATTILLLAPGMQQGTPLVYDGVMPMPNPRDVIQALDADTGEIVWKFEQRAGTTSLVATGGGLVFGLIGNGRFRALDHETGEVLREINLGSSVTGFAITYAVDGRQYVAVSTGTSLSSRDNMRLTPELRPSTGNNLFVFALPD